MKRPRMRAWSGVVLLSTGLGGLAASGDLIAHSVRLLVFYGLAAAGFGLLATAATSLSLRAALVAAVILRVIFLPVPPSLSDDVYRYAWDGRVQLAGINPYLYAPSDPALDRVAFAGRAHVNHPRLRTVYPPLAQAMFLAVAAAQEAGGGSPTPSDQDVPDPFGLPFKLLFGAFDLATAGAVWWLAGARRHAATVLYLMCPAVILQTWESAHLEAASVFFMVASAALLVRRHDWQAGVALGLAAALKVTPLILLVPALVGGRAKPARLLAGLIPALLIPYLPYLLTGGATGSLFQGGTAWTGRAVVFSALVLALVPRLALAICAALALCGAVWIALRLRGRDLTAAAFAWALTLETLCLPVVHAWYWIGALTLGLAAGLWVPVAIGMAAPIPEALTLAWRGPFAPWRQFGAHLSTRCLLPHNAARRPRGPRCHAHRTGSPTGRRP